MIKNISAWKISSLNAYSVQIRLGSNLGGFFISGRRKVGQVDHNSGKKGLEIISEETGDSPKQVQRYIKMADLIPELLEKVDDGSMGFTPAVQIAYLKKKEQKDVLDAMELTLCTPSLSSGMKYTESTRWKYHEV